MPDRAAQAGGAAWRLVVEAEPDEAMRTAILAPLADHNDRAAGPGEWGVLAITVRDAAGGIAGGLWGRTGYGFLFVELLAMGPAAGTGLGRQVMQAAEREASRRGLLGIWLDTWTFQAPGFYRKLGFSEVGRIADYPPGHDRVFFAKRLDGGGPAG